ncbi:hypothetical protein QQS21_009737 [Conoideocrella luteorostrata]|uniref:RING-type E3 ubiquitin transferase n=1 Tax=Conoideocrella luteorostrata TaxID=1105319 RepID=A0AAJ0FQ34_9HYPO|nr:hypothetical protein QQS21_009737 [Conoideocrella luteorostrata]
MFTQPVSSPPPGPQTANPVSPSRPSRLRGLSYLRNYTHSHLLSRDSHHSSSNSNASPRSQNQNGNLTRSVSYTPSSSLSAAAQNPNRLTLVSSFPNTPSAPPERAVGDASGFSSRATSGSTPPPIPEAISPITQSTSLNGLPQAATTANDQSDMTARPRPVSSGDAPTGAAVSSTANGVAATANATSDAVPSIRFSAYYDPRSTRPSLSFPPISRTLPNGTEVIRVGRYSERDGQAANMNSNQPSAAPVGFKSKVVSRRHCEFWCEDGKWYIKDVKSSSGTFLNHIRLSPPSQESKAYPVNDGDIVQLGIDFKGGEEMIFRCVKMRLELNRGWQNKLNSFNVAAHKRLRTMASSNNAAGSTGTNSQDCSICLNSIAPCQSLFVAPCSHTWHFKCVRSLLTSPQYPIFVCPNCRAGADLEADVDEPNEDWERLDEDVMETDQKEPSSKSEDGEAAAPEATDASSPDLDAMDVTVSLSPAESPNGRLSNGLPHPVSEPLPISNPASGSGRVGHLRQNRSPSPSANGPEGPITPRNNAGPWVFDGSAGRRVVDGSSEMRSLDAAAEMDLSGANQSDDSIR